MIKKYNNFINEAKDLSYENFFGKKITHNDALKDRIISLIINIVMNELHISEKSFKQCDEINKNIKSNFTYDMFIECEKMYNDDKRLEYIAEILFDKYKNIFLKNKL